MKGTRGAGFGGKESLVMMKRKNERKILLESPLDGLDGALEKCFRNRISNEMKKK